MVESDPTANDGKQPPSLSIVVDRAGDESVVTVAGDIDLETSAELSAVLESLDPPDVVNVDLGAVTYIDSTGLPRPADGQGGPQRERRTPPSIGDVEHRRPPARDHRGRRPARVSVDYLARAASSWSTVRASTRIRARSRS